jgi:pimeloyl-ACP methyl ester carboxylesterase
MNKYNLLLLPGLLNDERLWHHQITGLRDIANATVADISGADNIAELAQAALTQVPPGPFALAGLSMGGYVALEIMRQAPERVLALALLDTSANPDSAEATANRHKLMQLAQTDFTAVVESLLPKLVHPSHLADACQIRVITAMARDMGKDAFIRQQQAIIGREDSRLSLSRITCPTLVLCGKDDVITPLEIHREMRNAIPHAELRVIDHCGHLSTLGKPLEVTAALRGWLLNVKS